MKPTPIGAHMDSKVEYTIKLKNAPYTSFYFKFNRQFLVSQRCGMRLRTKMLILHRWALVKGIADILGNTNGDEISIDSVERVKCTCTLHWLNLQVRPSILRKSSSWRNSSYQVLVLMLMMMRFLEQLKSIRSRQSADLL